MQAQALQVGDLADLLEIRLDYMTVPEPEKCCSLLRRPLLFTNRPTWEGGNFAGTEEERIAPLLEAVRLRAAYVDLELRAALNSHRHLVEAIQEEPQLYHASPMDWLELIWGLDDALDHVMCFGHNPGLTDLANDISPLIIDNVPTCGVIDLEFDTDTWAQVGHIRAVRAEFDYPKK